MENDYPVTNIVIQILKKSESYLNCDLTSFTPHFIPFTRHFLIIFLLNSFDHEFLYI